MAAAEADVAADAVAAKPHAPHSIDHEKAPRGFHGEFFISIETQIRRLLRTDYFFETSMHFICDWSRITSIPSLNAIGAHISLPESNLALASSLKPFGEASTR